jgi:hypothetical protein
MDTGATGHFFKVSNDLENVTATTSNNRIHVSLPDGTIIKSTHTGNLRIPGLPLSALQAHVFPHLAANSLLSIAQLCAHGCQAIFTDTAVTITLQDIVVLTGARSTATGGLWTLTPSPIPSRLHPRTPPITGSVNAMFHTTLAHDTIANRIAFYHASCYSPSLSTWCSAIDAGHFTTWPGLTSAAVKKYPPQSMAMHQGHLDQARMNTRTTQARSPAIPIDISESTSAAPADADIAPPEPPSIRTRHIYTDCHATTGMIYTDPTGRFLTPSVSGNQYMLVVYEYDGNYIHSEPMIDRTGPSIIAAYKKAVKLFESRGFKPLLQRLDNEASSALQNVMDDCGITFQLAPPHCHRRNAAERAIRTFKNHFIAGLCSTNRDFPLNLWDKLLPQCLITLNLLRRSRINPQLSAQAHMHGAFDFNRTPLAPPGTKVLIHEKPDIRGTWAPHAIEGWYLGPATRHYRCYRVWAWSTNAERIADTLAWFPTTTIMPRHSSTDIAIAAAHDLTHALLHPAPASPLSPLTDSQHHTLLTLSDIFKQHTQRPDQVPTAPHTPSPPPPTMVAPTPPSDLTPPPLPRVAPASTFTTTPKPTASPPPRVVAPFPTRWGRTRKRDAAIPRVAPTTYPSVLRISARSTKHSTVPTPHNITWDPSVSGGIAPIATYQSATINPGIRRRRASKAQKLATDRAAFLSASITVHPGITATTWTKRRSASHRSRRRKRGQRLPTKTAAKLHSAHTVIDATTGQTYEHAQLIRGDDKDDWLHSTANEFGRLTKGIMPHMPSGSDTMRYIPHDTLPAGRKATYARFVATERPHKAETKRVRLTVGGNLIHYPDKVSTPTADLSTVKMLLNSVISTPGARFATFDLKDFYLGTPMARKEYMRIPISSIPRSIIHQYHLLDLIHNGSVLVEISRGMYGLPQAGILAYNQLVSHLKTHGYAPCTHTPGLWTHTTRDITFCLVVDDFGIKYTKRCDADHLLSALKELYIVTTDWTGSLYLAMTMAWDYTHHTVDISMPGYVAKALDRFQHHAIGNPQHSPHAWQKPQYGTQPQLTPAHDDSAILPKPELTRIQEIVGTLLFYGRAIDSTMLVALGTIASKQTRGTKSTAQAVTQLLNYAAAHPDATIRYHASDMCLHIHSDASYLSEANARSRAGGTFFLSSKPTNTTNTPNPAAPYNGAIHTISAIMANVMASATEAEFGALFHNARDAVPLRTALIEMGHPQPATPIQTDNACAAGLSNETVKQRRSKAIDMRFYWIRDRIKQGQFLVYWAPGTDNLADYFTKHHSPAHHKLMRSRYLLEIHKPVPA